ncbi:uncharacterized protein N7503_006451 [Penicillium pulvis]|uniref:uncharacterized protein n=1 Tax=Penicillium pulvis TaxID=1562058 RepID=UPI0025466411|nr:uncharacterized protein N7503_006451 [Penicillium pulvis]KAJ5798946.1 hypothetical protein N7503_006451 [Penicillium pulvis]
MEFLFDQSSGQESSIHEDNQLLPWESDDTYSNPSETASETIQSETSEDRDFVISDTDQLSYASPSSSNLSNASLKEKGLKKPIKTITRRSVDRNGRRVVQYLVLWYSWETNDPFQYEGLENS